MRKLLKPVLFSLYPSICSTKKVKNLHKFPFKCVEGGTGALSHPSHLLCLYTQLQFQDHFQGGGRNRNEMRPIFRVVRVIEMKSAPSNINFCINPWCRINLPLTWKMLIILSVGHIWKMPSPFAGIWISDMDSWTKYVCTIRLKNIIYQVLLLREK